MTISKRRIAAGLLSAAAAVVVLRAGDGTAERGVPVWLSDTGLYESGSLVVREANRAFSPQYPLWTDGAAKRRWVYLPPGGVIDGHDETAWELPVGTKFWKEFSFDGRPVETRLSWRVSTTEWRFASYVWTADGTNARLAPAEGVPGVTELAPGRRHNIPSVTDCQACHGVGRQGPLGFNVLQLSPDRDPNAVHGEPLAPDMMTLATLVNGGQIAGVRPDILTRPPRVASTDGRTRTVLGYLSANCGTCHNGRGEIAASGPTLPLRDLLEDGDRVADALFRQRTSWTVPGMARGASYVLDPSAPDHSAMLVRMRSRRPASQMPPLGTVLQDEEAIAALEAWLRTRGGSS